MLNLLLISDSPKAEHIKSVLQPMLKVIVDVVADFDHGLKDVFEKRPATVCIQDQINGVTGESVARHIQMLLGNSAPTFILLHKGDGKARVIKGVYEHLVDLSQSDDAVVENIKNTLKSLLGDQWGKVYIPPKPTPSSVISSAEMPEESREHADKLVEEFLSDLEMPGSARVDVHPPVPSPFDVLAEESSTPAHVETLPETDNTPLTSESEMVLSPSDEVAHLLRAVADESSRNVASGTGTTVAAGEAEVASGDLQKPLTAAEKPLSAVISRTSASPEITGRKTAPAAPAVSTLGKKEITSASTPKKAPAAEFRIRQNTSPAEERIPDDLLQAFEENYRSRSKFIRNSVAVITVCIVCAGGGWYLIKNNPRLLGSLKQRTLTANGAKQAPVTAPTVPPVQMPVPPPVPQAVVTSPLPSFISKDGRDSSYPVKNPGWERYVGKQAEFRVFSASGRIQALQVIAVKDAAIPVALIKTIMEELTGSSEYQITSRDTKAGVRIERGAIQDRGEVVVYRKSGAVKGLVVSVK